MTLDEWEQIGKRLAASFPASKFEAASILAYYEILAKEDVRDVAAGAAVWMRMETDWMPSAGRLLALSRIERSVRLEHERLPDFTGFSELPVAEQEALMEAGYRASAMTSREPSTEPVRLGDSAEAKELGA